MPRNLPSGEEQCAPGQAGLVGACSKQAGLQASGAGFIAHGLVGINSPALRDQLYKQGENIMSA